MFTGIVEERGRVVAVDGGSRIAIHAPRAAEDSGPGASVAVDGVCLTVVERDGEVLAFDVTGETLDRTTLGSLRPVDGVNLERPVTPLTRLGGHILQGHVDGVGVVRSVDPAEGGSVMRIEPPASLDRYLVEKGSVAVDGVSLTVAAVQDRAFEVALVPHTLAVTTLGDRGPGDRVNLEADILAKHVERILGRSG